MWDRVSNGEADSTDSAAKPQDKSPDQALAQKNFCSAATMASSTDRKQQQIPAHLQVPKSTKQFKAELTLSNSGYSVGKSTTFKALNKMSPPVRKIFPVSTFTLEK